MDRDSYLIKMAWIVLGISLVSIGGLRNLTCSSLLSDFHYLNQFEREKRLLSRLSCPLHGLMSMSSTMVEMATCFNYLGNVLMFDATYTQLG